MEEQQQQQQTVDEDAAIKEALDEKVEEDQQIKEELQTLNLSFTSSAIYMCFLMVAWNE